MKKLSEEKDRLRQEFLRKRKKISNERRQKVSSELLETLISSCSGFSYVLSFASFGTEIDLWPLNEMLAKENRLLLPRRTEEGLLLYKVRNIGGQLEKTGGLLEPNPAKCELFSVKDLKCALVPGIAFDAIHQRLGYGKGYYDRLLKETVNCLKIGIGFQEQLVLNDLPCETHDQKLDELLLL